MSKDNKKKCRVKIMDKLEHERYIQKQGLGFI